MTKMPAPIFDERITRLNAIGFEWKERECHWHNRVNNTFVSSNSHFRKPTESYIYTIQDICHASDVCALVGAQEGSDWPGVRVGHFAPEDRMTRCVPPFFCAYSNDAQSHKTAAEAIVPELDHHHHHQYPAPTAVHQQSNEQALLDVLLLHYKSTREI